MPASDVLCASATGRRAHARTQHTHASSRYPGWSTSGADLTGSAGLRVHRGRAWGLAKGAAGANPATYALQVSCAESSVWHTPRAWQTQVDSLAWGGAESARRRQRACATAAAGATERGPRMGATCGRSEGRGRRS